MTRTNEAIDKNAIHNFIATLEVSNEIKAELLQQLEERWQLETGNNALFISATTKRNIDQFRQTLLLFNQIW